MKTFYPHHNKKNGVATTTTKSKTATALFTIQSVYLKMITLSFLDFIRDYNHKFHEIHAATRIIYI